MEGSVIGEEAQEILRQLLPAVLGKQDVKQDVKGLPWWRSG